MPDIEESIINIIRSIAADKERSIDRNTDLFSAGILDSLSVINLIVRLQEDFGIVFSYEDLIPQNMENVCGIVQLIGKTLKMDGPEYVPSGNAAYGCIKDLYKIPRSLSGNGVRQTLNYIKGILPDLAICEVPSGTRAFDWTVPMEWNVNEAWIKDETGKTVLDMEHHNLCLVGYSVPVDAVIERDELMSHIHTLPDQPDAIPYVTSYYKERWGFCMTENGRKALKKGKYHVHIDSELKRGSLSYGEITIPGESQKEIFLSTYVCHPQMANDNLSGPVVAVELAKWIKSRKNKYRTRIVFIPETIGAIVYLSKHIEAMKASMLAGFVLTCLGDCRAFSLVSSRYANTLADRAAEHVLRYIDAQYRKYSFLDRGSDERQYCAPGVDLPVCSVMRSKYGEYPEYHTSLDNLSLVSPEGLQGSIDAYRKIIMLIEMNQVYRVQCLGEPNLGKRALYPTLSTKESGKAVRSLMNFIAYADGKNDLIRIADTINLPAWELYEVVARLTKEGLIRAEEQPD